MKWAESNSEGRTPKSSKREITIKTVQLTLESNRARK